MTKTKEKAQLIEFNLAGKNHLAWIQQIELHALTIAFKVDFLLQERTCFIKMNSNGEWVETNNRKTKLAEIVGSKIEDLYL